MNNFFIKTITYSLFITTIFAANNEPKVINNFHFHNSATQIASSTNMLSAVQQMPISPALFEKIAKNGRSILNKNKLLLIALAGVYVYGRTFISVVRANHALAEKTAWASWKSELSLDELKTLDQTDLTKELLHEIQKRHTNAQKPADALLPFITFLGVIDDEISHLNNYRSLHFWIETCHATWMFPLNQQRFASATARLERLWFVKNLFLSWAADYKLSSYIKSPTSLAARLYAYLCKKFGDLWPETEIEATNPTDYLAAYQKQARNRTLITTLAEAACIAPALVIINSLLPTRQKNYTIDTTVNVYC